MILDHQISKFTVFAPSKNHDFKTVFMPFCSGVLTRGTKFYNITNNCTGIAQLVLKNCLANIEDTKI